MKRIVFLILFLLFLFLPLLPCQAAQSPYQEQYDGLDIDEIKDSLDGETRRLLEQNGIDPKNPDWVNNLSDQGVFEHIKDFLQSGMKTPIKSGAAILGVIIITAAITAFGTDNESSDTAIFACTVSCAAIISVGVLSSLTAAADAMKACSTFMLAFIPIFASIVTLSGGAVTSVSMSSLLLGAAELVSAVSSFFIMPFMGGYLSLSVASGVSPLLPHSTLAETIKKISLWTFSLASTLFIGILGIQTAVNSAADSVALKTAKFIIGTSVPISGTVLAEAAATISASMGLLRSSVGIYGVVAVAFTVLPIVIELILWKIIITLLCSLADGFSLAKMGGFLRAIDSMFSILLGLLLLVAGLFIISLTVIVSAGK